MPTSADSKNNCVANGSPATHQTLWQQGGTGEDSYIHLADWTLSVTAIEKKKKKKKKKKSVCIHMTVCGYKTQRVPLQKYWPNAATNQSIPRPLFSSARRCGSSSV